MVEWMDHPNKLLILKNYDEELFDVNRSTILS